MDKEFFIDRPDLSEEARKKKYLLENDPSCRSDPMEYMDGMEKIDSNICELVMKEVNSYDWNVYTGSDVENALARETCTIEDFKALLSPAALPYLEKMAVRAQGETRRHFGKSVYLFTPLYIANYCENYCVYCGFNCYNNIHRKKLSTSEMEKEMEVIAKSGIEEILMHWM